MIITIDTNVELSTLDLALIGTLIGNGPVATPLPESTPTKAEAKAPAKKATPAKPAPEPEPETVEADEEDLLGGTEPEADAPTMADAVAAATKLVSSQKGSVVKAALTDLGVKRVSELKDDQIAAFLAALA